VLVDSFSSKINLLQSGLLVAMAFVKTNIGYERPYLQANKLGQKYWDFSVV